MKKRLTLLFFLLFTLMLAVCLTARAENEAKIITADASIIVSAHKKDKAYLTDGNYINVWDDAGKGYVDFTMKKGVPCYGIYLQWDTLVDFAIQIPAADGSWQDVQLLHADYYNQYVVLDGYERFRVQSMVTDRKKLMGIREVTLFSDGTLPEWVQLWTPYEGKADILVIPTHPDDEYLFFGGLIPDYGTERGVKLQVAYIASVSARRRIELLDGLWTCGIRYYPQMPTSGFKDVYAGSKSGIFKTWRESNLEDYLTWLVRKYQPEVIVTHDLNGEYGHGAHKAVSSTVCTVVTKLGAKENYNGARSKDLAPWQVKKLYIHLYDKNRITVSWNEPLSAFGGKTGLQIAQEAYLCHRSQQNGHHLIEDTDVGAYNSKVFGLYYTAVGEDVEKNDFLENIQLTGDEIPAEATEEEIPEEAVIEEVIEEENAA